MTRTLSILSQGSPIPTPLRTKLLYINRILSMESSSLVSIIVPVYNGIDYIRPCLSSIEEQDYPHKQLILVDDGSTDGSSDFLEEYAALRPWVQVIHQNNTGVSVARNSGLKEARGAYIIFHDCDDIMLPSMISSLFQALETTPNADLAAVGFLRCSSGETDEYPVLYDGRKDRDLPNHQALRYLNTEVWGKIYRSEVIKSNNLTFRTDMTHGEDQDFVARYLMLSRKVSLVHLYLMKYMVHTGSATDELGKGMLPEKIYIDQFTLWTKIAKDMPSNWSRLEKKMFGESLVRRQFSTWRWMNETLRANQSPLSRKLARIFWHNVFTMVRYMPIYAVTKAAISSLKRYGLRKLI